MMNKNELEKLYENYIYTLECCGNFLLEKDDEILDYNIFEEFDIGRISFLHDEALNPLLATNYINKEVYEKSQRLRKLAFDLDYKDLWYLNKVRNSIEWKELFDLSDEIKKMLDIGNGGNVTFVACFVSDLK